MKFGDAFYEYPNWRTKVRWWFGDRYIQLGHFLVYVWKKLTGLFKKKPKTNTVIYSNGSWVTYQEYLDNINH